MHINNINPHDTTTEQQCAKCKEYEDEVDAYGTLLLVISFIGPVVGMLIGLFAGKKLLEK